jgi:hypothetical protein
MQESLEVGPKLDSRVAKHIFDDESRKDRFSSDIATAWTVVDEI